MYDGKLQSSVYPFQSRNKGRNSRAIVQCALAGHRTNKRTVREVRPEWCVKGQQRAALALVESFRNASHKYLHPAGAFLAPAVCLAHSGTGGSLSAPSDIAPNNKIAGVVPGHLGSTPRWTHPPKYLRRRRSLNVAMRAFSHFFAFSPFFSPAGLSAFPTS